MTKMGWWEWIMGLFVIVWDSLCQRISSVTLQPGLPTLSLSHLTCIITSCSPGIALETARHLAKSGAHVVFAVADVDAVRELIARWEDESTGYTNPPLNCEVMKMDCLVLDSVRKFSVDWEARKLPLNVLINISSSSYMDDTKNLSRDGYEHHMQVHHIGHLDADDLNLSGNKKRWNTLTAHANSKLAQLLFSNLLQRRLPKETGIDIICMHPGQVVNETATGWRGIIQKIQFNLFSPLEGARSLLFCVTDKQVQDYARALRSISYPLAPYFGSDCRPCAVARQVHDMHKANLVWQETLRLVGIPVEVVEEAVNESDPVDVTGDVKYMDVFPEVSNDEGLDFLLGSSNDNDDSFGGLDAQFLQTDFGHS
ncbi:dehydrogenase/reductase SDR family member FEY isoform X4 [Physcomitrium patens]|uniref:dehydrogenase/reductase SDR family member FEY isoform X4 n=1 Tax=Physcomitrium patens TaxID=3218 RepID=UPI003CCD309A